MIYPSSAAQLLASRNIYGVAIVLLLLWVPCYSAHAQVRCGTVEYMEQLRNQNKIKETKQDFENWLSKRIGLLKTQSKANRSQATTYQVPVVVHVIHNGEAVGVGSNISDAQIQSQIDVINDDYKRLNADATNTPSAFSAVAGIMDIEFILAKQDPEGLPTSGIVRVNGNKSAWTMNDNTQLKSLSYWPAEDYLNLWVCNLTDLLGYTQFPVSDLPGLENASKNRLTDGVVIAYEAFGTVNEGPFELDPSYDLGRTATHEIGHFFGLRHIWGDDDSGSPCSEDDYVADTPLQATSTTTCPSGVVTDPCTTTAPGIMYENYLDYTDDACMNVFTQGQVDRMQAVIESSPRRASLLSSHGLQDPVMVANDLGIRSIIAPEKKICDPQVTSVLEVRNYGTNAITSTKIQVSINGSPVLTQSFSVSLSVDEITTITLNPVTVDNGDALSFDITETNGGTDNNSLNNNAARTITFQNTGIVPFDEPMDALPSGWTISNPDSSSTWTVVTAPNGNSVNKAMQMNFYDYDKAGETDRLLTPVFDFAPLDAAALHFDVSYAQFPGQNGDSLKVVVLTDCENDISKGTVIYAKGGSSLSTSPSISASFKPSAANQWRSEVVDLTPFLGEPQLQIVMMGINGYGNNLYLDNVMLVAEAQQDLRIVRMLTPSPVICTSPSDINFVLKNQGSISLIEFTVDYSVNGGAVTTLAYSDTDIIPGQSITVTIPGVDFSDGLNNLSITVHPPSGQTDVNPANNSIDINLIVNNSTDLIPLRQTFESSFIGSWPIVNPNGGAVWETINTNYGRSVYFNASSDSDVTDKAWLVSPILDFTISTEASLFFDVSYDGIVIDRLKVMASTDCGQTFINIPFNASSVSTLGNVPAGVNDWANAYVNLTSFAGYPEVRVAFVFTNDHGKDLFLDNIEFFIAANPNPLRITKPYAIYNSALGEDSDFKITFNLPTRQTVDVAVVDMMGRIVFHSQASDILNQTFPIQLESSAGVYIVKLGIGGTSYGTRVLVRR